MVDGLVLLFCNILRWVGLEMLENQCPVTHTFFFSSNIYLGKYTRHLKSLNYYEIWNIYKNNI